MIDWTKPELYCHFESKAEIVRVHVIPDWCAEEYPVIIEWSDGFFDCYTMDGRCTKASALPHVIPKPRKPRVVEGWTKEGFSRNGGWSFVVHQVEQVGERWVKVRVEEVTDEPA